MDYKMLFSPMKIGKCEIKNRIVMAPMLMGFGQLDGQATEQMMDYYEERAKGGTGLIITEITRVNDVTGAGAFAQLGVSHDYQIEKLAEFAFRIHKYGAKLFVQLHHPGRQNIGLLVGTVPLCIACTRVCKSFPKMLYKVAPSMGKILIEKNLTPASVSASKCEPSYFAGGRVRALRHSEIKKLVKQFVEGAVRCKKAGVDGVELHATHGYLLQQFLSPNTNKRTDEYGGSFENRLRFIKEIVEGIREECGDYPIIVRLTIDEFYDKIGKNGKGYTMDEGVKYAKAIEAMGVDAIDVSSAAYDTFNYWLEPTSFDCGWRKYLAAAVKQEVKIPVLAANLIRSAEQAEKQLEEGAQDFVSLGRPHIADPHWAEKVQSGREDEIQRCICCLYCIQSMQDNAYEGGHGGCAVNPAVGNEREFNGIKKDGNGRVVIIVGAGVAGLKAAELLGLRGFKPVVLEQSSQIGGQIQLASKPPKKDKLNWCFEDMRVKAEKNGAKIVLNTAADYEVIKSYKPYAVIIATGAAALMPKSIKGVGGANVFSSTDVLSGSKAFKNKKIVVVGSGMTGLETAELLVASKNKVTIVEMAQTLAPGAWFQHVDDIKPKLDEAGTEYILSHKLASIDETGVNLQPVTLKKGVPLAAGEERHYDCDAVVLSLGACPVNCLAQELKGKFEKLFVIGDARKIGRIADATAEAYEVAVRRIK
jgi:2,4-dienoyl-CoA reductase-like NADH-dependent reductase (Old Yellow Enzyme family)/thioredoxin reductase